MPDLKLGYLRFAICNVLCRSSSAGLGLGCEIGQLKERIFSSRGGTEPVAAQMTYFERHFSKLGGCAAAGLLGLLMLLPTVAFGFCHEIEVVRRVAYSGDPGAVTLEWFGHATFQITSSKGTRILTDPHTRDDLFWPTLPQHVVTTSHQHGSHSNIWMARGSPVVLHGLSPGGETWNKIHTTIRDASIYTVPAFHDKSQGLQRGKNAIFVFRVDNICIAHLGDLGHHLTPEQIKMMGKIDILLIPLAGGMYTVTPGEAREVVKQVNPRISIPNHYWWDGAVEEFTEGHPRVRKINGRVFTVAKHQLPQPTEIVVLAWNAR